MINERKSMNDHDVAAEMEKRLEKLAETTDVLESRQDVDPAEVAGWVCRLAGNTQRIASLLCNPNIRHAPDIPGNPADSVSRGDAVSAAQRFEEYRLSHTPAPLRTIPEPMLFKLANRILRMPREIGMTEFSRRSAMRYCRSIKAAEDMQQVIDFLEHCSYIRRLPGVPAAPAKGRPSLPMYAFNPDALSKDDHHA